MAPIKTIAIVIKAIKWKDTSKIVTLYTREAGKVGVIAKGARKFKNPYAGVLESINLVEIVLYMSSKRQLQVLGTATLEKSYQKIKIDFNKTSYVYGILELISILIPTGSVDVVFFDFVQTLLEEMGEIEDPRIIFWFFLIKISSYLGFRPEFNICSVCSGELNKQDSSFSFHKGGLLCNSCCNESSIGWKLNSKTRKFMNELQKMNYRTISAKSLIIDERFSYTEFLLSYLRYHLDEKLELNSLKILK